MVILFNNYIHFYFKKHFLFNKKLSLKNKRKYKNSKIKYKNAKNIQFKNFKKFEKVNKSSNSKLIIQTYPNQLPIGLD